MREEMRVMMREHTRTKWRVRKRGLLRVELPAVIREMQRGSMRESPHDQVRSAQRFDGRVCIRDVLRDRSQDDVRAEGWACVRGGT